MTSKGSKDLAGGRRLHLMVAVAFGKGVVLKVPYVHMNGNYFAQFVRDHFNITFARAGPKRNGRRLFFMDNDPSQRSRAARVTLNEVKAECHDLPPRSPDSNCIENIFNLVKRYLEDEAVALNITNESFEEFTERVLRAFDHIPVEVISRTISSISKRIEAIIASKGYRTKY